MLPPCTSRRRDLRRAILFTLAGTLAATPAGMPGGLEGAIDQPARGLVAPQVPVLWVAEHDRDDDLWLLGRRVSDEPRVLHVERLGPRQRAGLAGDVDRLAAAERPGGAAE